MIFPISILYLLPRNTAIILLRAYRGIISPVYGTVCRFHPSCSSYAITAIQEYGFFLGLALTFRRLIRCNPWSRGGINDVPLRRKRKYRTTPFGFVVTIRQERG